uniref:Uncharacterized protein n=1 Tax=Schizaphis graminum TaxID=13262 RepID=A0A2S2N9W9_SCHGA
MEIRGSNRSITHTGPSGHGDIRYGQRVPGNSITIFCIYNNVITYASISRYTPSPCAHIMYILNTCHLLTLDTLRNAVKARSIPTTIEHYLYFIVKKRSEIVYLQQGGFYVL